MVRVDYDVQMFCGLPVRTRCLLRCVGLIDKEACLFQAGLLQAEDIEDASDHDLLEAGLNRDQIRHLRRAFVFRESLGLPYRRDSEKSRLYKYPNAEAHFNAERPPQAKAAASPLNARLPEAGR